jgi:hypothetical protein
MLKLLSKGTVRIAAAMIIGALIGLLVFTIAQISGRNLYIIIGAAAGAAAPLVVQRYRQTARLAEVKITVPQFSELRFVVNDDARQVAWKLYVEIITRVSTQPLTDEQGFLADALESLYGLFGSTRQMLEAGRPSVPAHGAQTVEYLAVTMLNRHLRPFLSKWHPQLREFERRHPMTPESEWSGRAECRSELRRLQSELVTFALGFADLAGVRDPVTTVIPPDQTSL